MPMRELCKTPTGKVRKHRKDGKCPQGTRKTRTRVKKGRKRRK